MHEPIKEGHVKFVTDYEIRIFDSCSVIAALPRTDAL